MVDGIPAVSACILDAGPISLSSLISPDYPGVRAEGRTQIDQRRSSGLAIVEWRGRSVWFAWDPEHATLQPGVEEGWHGHLMSINAEAGHLDVLLGAGPVGDSLASAWLARARRTLHGDQLS